MSNFTIKTLRALVFVAVAGLACIGAGFNYGPGPAGGGNGPGSSTPPPTADEVSGMLFMREEEKLARDSYLVLSDTWGLNVFANIALSEQQHMDAVKKLLVKFGLTDPVTDESDIGTFSDPVLQELYNDLFTMGQVSPMDGLKVGALIEETDIRDIGAWIGLSSNTDIIATYESLLCGSRNHLRAFVGQIELWGGTYLPSYIDEATFEAIVNSPTERTCGRNQRGGGH